MVRYRKHHADDAGSGLGVGHVGDFDHVGAGLGHPVEAGDAQVEVAVLDEDGNLLRPQDLDLADARIADRGVVLSAGLLDLEVGLREQEHRLLLEGAFGKGDGQHRDAPQGVVGVVVRSITLV